MQQKEKLINMVERNVDQDSNLMIDAILSVLRMRDPSCGASAMLALISSHFIIGGCSKEEFLNICSKTYSFYKLQIDEENAKREKKDVNQ